ncbi:MAG: AMP-binding protein, partial [Turneriella sp.]|nr:AMP-binding protein [Turneriella sp.]
MSEKRILWQPQPDNAMQKFREFVNQKMGADFRNYQELYAFSVSHSEDFWRLFVEYIALPLRKPPLQILERHTPWRKSRWFVGAEINWAEIALESRRNSDQLAAISYDENGLRAELSYRKLYTRVAAFAATLKAQGLKPGDHFAVFMPNT